MTSTAFALGTVPVHAAWARHDCLATCEQHLGGQQHQISSASPDAGFGQHFGVDELGMPQIPRVLAPSYGCGQSSQQHVITNPAEGHHMLSVPVPPRDRTLQPSAGEFFHAGPSVPVRCGLGGVYAPLFADEYPPIRDLSAEREAGECSIPCLSQQFWARYCDHVDPMVLPC
jgi:hypothetical protein